MLVDLAVGALPGGAVDAHIDAGLDGATLDGDESRLVQALGSLLAFACSRDAKPPRLRAWREGGRVLIEVSDLGAPVGDVSRLLLDPLPEPYDLGLGLRLLIAAAILDAHGGELLAEARDPGLALRMALPLTG
jgi:C4-dicarboxylate-specific signal transduction histidine kinase